MKTITAEQFAKMYGQESLNSFDDNQKVAPSVEPIEPKLTDIVGQDIADRTTRVGDILNRKDTGLVTKGVQVFGQGAGLAANTLEQTAMKVPGIKQVAKGIGEGINWLTTSDISPVKALGDVIGSNKILQIAVRLYDTDQNFKDSIDAVANIVRLGGDVDGVVNSANFAANITNKVIKNVKNVSTKGIDTVKAIDTQPASSAIMNKIARLKPTDMTEFERLAGKTPGQYLVDTGNFGTPDKIISTEATKYVKSKAMVDTEMAKLPGVYKYGAVEDALNQLLDTAKNTSTPNVPAPYLEEVNSLIQKYKSGGLTMEEINRVKRLFEREVKLGYNKVSTPSETIKRATNVDSAIRNWQISKAKDLGFNNITDLNKQTQLSRFIVDKLGDQVIGQSGLNFNSLTDWIVLSGGNPEAVAGFLTKKFFSSRAVQAKIAELLNVGQPVKSIISPDVKPTVESALRTQWPEGTRLELPPALSKIRSSMPSGEVMKVTPSDSNMELTSKTGVNLSSKPAQPPVLEKSRISSSNSSIKNANSQGGFIDIGKMSSDIKSLFQEAKKYKTAEEFVKAQETKSPDYAVGGGSGHTAPLRNGEDAPAFDLTQLYPDDIYSEKATRLYGSGFPEADKKAILILQKIKGNPDAEVTIYRAVPEGKNIKDINKGDWVTLTKEYAKVHGESNLGGKYEILSKKVKADEIFTEANSIQEFGYDPRSLNKSQLTDIWNKANNKK